MLALLKPWRDLQELKEEDENWEYRFNLFLETASLRDKDIISGSQYYYESKNIVTEREIEDEIEPNIANRGDDDDDFEDENIDASDVNPGMVS